MKIWVPRRPRRDGGWRGFRDLAAIDLSNQGLAGPVPPALPRLAAGRLRDLDLTLNRFRGDCPPDLLRARLAHGARCGVPLVAEKEARACRIAGGAAQPSGAARRSAQYCVYNTISR